MKQHQFGKQTFNYNNTIEDIDFEDIQHTPEEQAIAEKAECHDMFKFVQAYKGVIYKTVKFNLAGMFEQENFMDADEKLSPTEDKNLERAFSNKKKLDKELYQNHKQEYQRGLMMIDIFYKCQNILINEPVKKTSHLVDSVIKTDLKEAKKHQNKLFKITDDLFDSHVIYNQSLNNYFAHQKTSY